VAEDYIAVFAFSQSFSFFFANIAFGHW